MSAEWFALWWPAFLTTLIVEVPLIGLMLRERIGVWRALAIGVLLQCLTHPLFWIIWDLDQHWFYAHYDEAVLGFEAAIYLVEAGVIWLAIPKRKSGQRMANSWLALCASGLANTASLVVGILNE